MNKSIQHQQMGVKDGNLFWTYQKIPDLLDQAIADEAEANTVGDGVDKGHHRDGQRCAQGPLRRRG